LAQLEEAKKKHDAKKKANDPKDPASSSPSPSEGDDDKSKLLKKDDKPAGAPRVPAARGGVPPPM